MNNFFFLLFRRFLFSNQFVDVWGLSMDDCIARYFQPHAVLEVRPFWSTTPDVNVISHFTGLVQYTILPNPNRFGWNGRNINAFSVALFQNEV